MDNCRWGIREKPFSFTVSSCLRNPQMFFSTKIRISEFRRRKYPPVNTPEILGVIEPLTDLWNRSAKITKKSSFLSFFLLLFQNFETSNLHPASNWMRSCRDFESNFVDDDWADWLTSNFYACPHTNSKSNDDSIHSTQFCNYFRWNNYKMSDSWVSFLRNVQT